MDPITAAVVHNRSREKEQPTLKLNNKIIFRSLEYASIHDQRLTIHAGPGDFAYTLRDGANPSSKKRLHSKVKMANFIFGDQARKQNLLNFSHAYTTDLGTIFIMTPSYTSIC